MAAATQEQVRRAIERSNASGTAAEVLAAITNKTVTQTDSDRKHYSDVSTLLTRAGLPGDAIVDGIRADLLANGPAWICDQLGGIGIDFSHDQLQSKLDEMQTAGRITSQLATILKGIGRWQESPLEYYNTTRGLTTDEEAVQQVLDAIAAEAAAEAERQAQAAEEVARKVLIGERHAEIARRWNAAYAVIESGGTVEESIAVFAAE